MSVFENELNRDGSQKFHQDKDQSQTADQCYDRGIHLVQETKSKNEVFTEADRTDESLREDERNDASNDQRVIFMFPFEEVIERQENMTPDHQRLLQLFRARRRCLHGAG